MAYQPYDRRPTRLTDWLPLIVVAVLCFVVVAFNIHI